MNSADKKEKDDIDIDLTKMKSSIKKAFKRKPKASEKHHQNAKEKNESRDSKDVVEFDFTSIKKLFKRERLAKLLKSEDDEKDENIEKATKFVKKHYAVLLTILAIFTSVAIGVDIRLDAGDLSATEGWARNSFEQTMRNDLQVFAAQNYPNLPDRNRQAFVDDEIRKAYDSNQYTFKTGSFASQTIDVNQQVQVWSSQIKPSFQDSEGRNYMPDIDTYYWLRYAENLMETGQIGDIQKEGKQWDDHQIAPIGRPIPRIDTFYPLVIVQFHKFLGKPVAKILDANSDLIRTFMFLPVFLMALTTVLVFLITRRIAGNIAAFFAATMISVHQTLMARTMFGHADSDALVIFLSVLVLWLMIESFVALKLKWKVAWAALAGIATCLYSFAWGGWWWIFDFILAASAITIGLVVLQEILKKIKSSGLAKSISLCIKDNILRKNVTAVLAYVFASGASITLFTGISNFIASPFGFLGFTTSKDPVADAASPNVLRTVAELNEGTVQQAIDQIGSGFFYMAVLGIIIISLKAYMNTKKYSDRSKMTSNIFFATILTIWFVATLYAVTKGTRFTLLVIPAFSIGFGVLFGTSASFVSGILNKEFKFNKAVSLTAMFLALMLIFPGPAFNGSAIQESRSVAQSDVPLINDAWFNALTKIKENSKENAIITSWWDFGHQFKQIADRPVTFDGGTQSTPQAHWVGRFFSTDNEKEAVGILRMLNCGANTGTELINDKTKKSVEAFELTKKIIIADRDQAKKTLLQEGFTKEQAEDILSRTHCEPPESFVIASQDMIGKSGVWGHFGAWNFTKADIWKATQGKNMRESLDYMKNRFGIEEDEGRLLFNQIQLITDDRSADTWISPWPGFYQNVQACQGTKNNLTCGDGLVINLTSAEAEYPSLNTRPASLVHLTDNEVVEKTYDNQPTQPLSVLIFPQGKSHLRIIASPEIVDGMFSKMFYLQGHGLKCFKLLTVEQSVGTEIYVWQADWNCKQKNVIPELAPGAKNGDTVTLNYIGFLNNGTPFDSSIVNYQNKNITGETTLDDKFEYAPFTFTIGAGQVIPGFEKGITGMEAGEERVIVIPPELGYNVEGHPLYNKTLNFKLKIVNIQ